MPHPPFPENSKVDGASPPDHRFLTALSFPNASVGNPALGLNPGSPINTFGDDNLKHNAVKTLTATYETASNDITARRALNSYLQTWRRLL